jgi:hypothetical protein
MKMGMDKKDKGRGVRMRRGRRYKINENKTESPKIRSWLELLLHSGICVVPDVTRLITRVAEIRFFFFFFFFCGPWVGHQRQPAPMLSFRGGSK